MSDDELLDNIRQNLANETDRMCEDMQASLEESITQWNCCYWHRIQQIVTQATTEGKTFSLQRFANLCYRCKSEYRQGNARSVEHQRNKLRKGDENLILRIEHMKLRSYKQELTNWRLEKRAILASFYEKKLTCDQEVRSEINSIRYEEFLQGPAFFT